MPTTKATPAATTLTGRERMDSLPGSEDGTGQTDLSPSLRSETKAEIERIFDWRPPDRLTKWPHRLDVEYGNPADLCRCGHAREDHDWINRSATGACQCEMSDNGWVVCGCPCPKFRPKKKHGRARRN